ncbi:uncharacterized protein BCR38DRAFT_429121 [Pseudomassariella vexata]|uniref:BZIP domain-containing protein n=1 Tax=Pseudomassariella vexata TaxID=1141098 RepID=A0A1Y2E3Y1_9PEZI|nr:uncharacterized protein BCR38DRAFT_429121 [Pseudomassariella vexata]ORY66054.1 hypothetical protein BCR38DRAFT_429121 [Pseudomassariella vexata]
MSGPISATGDFYNNYYTAPQQPGLVTQNFNAHSVPMTMKMDIAFAQNTLFQCPSPASLLPDMDATVKPEDMTQPSEDIPPYITPPSDGNSSPDRFTESPNIHTRALAVTSKKRRTSWASPIDPPPPAAPGSTSREKNRIAATKCRQKKKKEERKLEEKRRFLEAQNVMLSNSAAALRYEVLQLKHEVLKHGTCGFPPIETYIESSAAHFSR